MALSSDQASALAEAYSQGMEAGHFAEAQSLADQWGVTYSDVEQAFPDFDISTLNPSISLGGERSGGGGGGGGGGVDYSDLVNQAYSSLGFTNTADPNYGAGFNYWTGQLSSGALTPADFDRAFLTSAASITDPAYAQYVNQAQSMIDRYTTGMDFINTNIGDPVTTTRWLESQGYTPEEIYAAQRYSVGAAAPTLDVINNYLEQGRSGYDTRFNDILSSTFGDEESRNALARTLTGREDATFNLKQDAFSNMSFEDIQKTLQESQLNRAQEAVNLANLAQNYFGLSDEDTKSLIDSVYKGESDNDLANRAYNELLTTGTISDETRAEMLQTAAQSNPNAPIFEQNPQLREIYTPIGETTGGRLVAGQYGYVNNAPILSADELNEMMGNSNRLGSSLDRRTFDYGSNVDDKLGWDLFSKYGADIRRGAAIYGVDEKPTDLKQIFNAGDQFQQLKDEGKVREVVDPENGEVTYLINAGEDSEGGIKWETPSSFFNTANLSEENVNPNGLQNFQTYQESVQELNQAAQALGLNPADYDSTEALYNAVNEKEDRVVVTGNIAAWDPTKTGGIGGGGVDTGKGEHVQVVYQQVGDKLVPIKTSDVKSFQDPKTSGLQAQVAKYAPLISMATLPFGGIGGLLSGVTAPMTTALSTQLGSQLAAQALTNAIVQGGIGALTGSDDILKSMAAAGAGTYLGGGKYTGDGVGKNTYIPGAIESALSGVDFGVLDQLGDTAGLIGKVGGAGAQAAILGGDYERAITNQLLREGVSGLTKTGDDGTGILGLSKDQADTLSKVVPALLKGNLSDQELILLAASLAGPSRG